MKIKKKLLITGAFGLVGSSLCRVIERDMSDIEITKVKFDEDIMVTDKFDYIIYASGYGQPQMFGKDKLKTLYINTTCVANTFTLLKPEGKFLFISTSEVYSGAPSPHKETYIGTTTPQHPRACYIEGKRCGEAICMAYKELGFDVKIARLALAYGPGTKKGDTRVINQFIEQALTKKITMKDNGSAMRTYVYVDDAVDMLLDVLFKGKEVVYNVGGNSRSSIRDLADEIGRVTGALVIEGSEELQGSPEDVRVCLNRINAEFPRNFITFEEGLKRTIAYQQELYGK